MEEKGNEVSKSVQMVLTLDDEFQNYTKQKILEVAKSPMRSPAGYEQHPSLLKMADQVRRKLKRD